METIFSRTGSTLSMGGEVAIIPEDITAVSILYSNNFVPGGEYKDDGYIYINSQRTRKWFKHIDDVKIWHPILNNAKSLQRRYNAIKERYEQYWTKITSIVYNDLMKAGQAHVKITHKYEGDYPPWWIYTASKTGISFDWVDEPKEPINLTLGAAYYHAMKRQTELGGRNWRFKKILMQAINQAIDEIPGRYGEQLQVKVLDKVYWFQHTKDSWEIITKDGEFKTVEL